jgi:hypothetical protein
MNDELLSRPMPAEAATPTDVDPFLCGLGGPAGPLAHEPYEEAARLAAAREMLNRIDAQAASMDEPSSPANATESGAATDAHLPTASSTQSGTGLPDGAILAANGQPFRDADAARFKMQRLIEEIGEPFEVVAVSVGGYAVVARAVSSAFIAPTGARSSQPAARPDVDGARPAPSSAPRSHTTDVESLTLAELPDGHPAHKYGLAAYRTMLKLNRKPLRQAWRSQLLLLVIAALGLLTFLVPAPATRLIMPHEALAPAGEVMANTALTKGVALSGLAFALFALGKVIFVRLYFRYLLAPNYCKSERGIIARQSTKMVYSTILTTDLHQSALGRILNFGTIELSCAAADGAEILIANVWAPEIVQAVIESRVAEARSVAFR